MRFIAPKLFIGFAIATLAAQAHATTTVDFYADATNADFIVPAAPGVLDRGYNLLGSLTYASGLADGTYGAGILSAFTLNVHRSITITGPLVLTADYAFSLGDLSTFSLTLLGGAPTGAAFSVIPKLPTTSSVPGLATQYLSVSFDGDYGFNVGPSPTDLTLVAHDGQSGITSISTGVPEPETWALMIVGLVAIGATMRRRRALVRIAYT
ncbi:MAG: PEPxxWA-CTERM sorting domain-containing protein [Sphingomonadales bacterium]|nr:PEPxxWA-CTERM sorting domain-containing protein [Sphingomonadales bacterium]